MNNLKSLGLFLMMSTALLTGCLDETGPTETDDNAAAAISAKIGGTAWSASAPTATRVVPPNALTMIGSSSSTGDYISINLRASATGSYSLSGSSHLAIYKKNGTEYTTAQNGSGTITVTKYDEAKKLISGTFSFVAKTANGAQITVTDGKFTNVKWVEQ